MVRLTFSSVPDKRALLLVRVRHGRGGDFRGGEGVEGLEWTRGGGGGRSEDVCRLPVGCRGLSWTVVNFRGCRGLSRTVAPTRETPENKPANSSAPSHTLKIPRMPHRATRSARGHLFYFFLVYTGIHY